MSTPTDATDVWTCFDFLPRRPDLPGALALLQVADLGFTPAEVTVDAPSPTPISFPFDDTAWARILQTPEVRGFDLDMGNLEEPRLSCRAGLLSTEVQLSGIAPRDGLLEALLDTPGLIVGARGAWEDARWQGEQNPNHYRWWYDGEWEHLPRTVDKHGRERIDVSGNPGRITDVARITLWAAQDLWFGPDAALVVDYDAIKSLPVGRLTDLGEGRWHVRLWDEDATLDEIRAAQRTLRDHLGYDAAAERVDEIRAALTQRAG